MNSVLKSKVIYFSSALLGIVSVGGCSQVESPSQKPIDFAAGQTRCDAIISSVVDAGFADQVDVSCANGQAILVSNTYPGHPLMTGIVGSNEQVPVPADSYAAQVPLNPVLGDTPKTRDAALGVAVNGVPIYDYTGGGEMTLEDLKHHQEQHDTLETKQLDECGGHAGRGDDYHYHVKPKCMIAQMANAGDDAIIGWAHDGYPIYGDNNPDGTTIAPGTLGVCNGQPDPLFGYRYHTSQDAPYIVQCLMGQIGNFRDLPRVSPLRPAQGSEPMSAGRPPAGGVENLTFSQNEDGRRSMDYRYQGEEYYIRYRPSENEGCYLFETRTVTNRGQTKSGEYCR